MTNSSLQFEIEQMRMKNIQRTMESILMLLAALFVTALLPSLLLRYVYTSEQLLTQPRALELIPVVAFTIAVAYFLYVVITNIARDRKMAQLEKEVMELSPLSGDADLNAAELAELEVMVEQALEETASTRAASKPARTARKSTKSRATRRAKK